MSQKGIKCPSLLLLVVSLLFQTSCVEIINYLSRVALRPSQNESFSKGLSQRSCYFHAASNFAGITLITSGLVCGYQEFWGYGIAQLSSGTQDDDIKAIFSRQLSQYINPSWAINTGIIVGQGDLKMHFIDVQQVTTAQFTTESYAQSKSSLFSATYPSLLATHSGYIAEMIEDTVQATHTLRVHLVSFSQKIFVRNNVYSSFQNPLSALHLTSLNGLTTLFALRRESSSSTLYAFQETTITKEFKELSQFSTNSAVCDSVHSSERYIALGCPSDNKVVILEKITKREVCAVTGGIRFGSDVALFDHPLSNITTVYVSAWDYSNIHSVTQLHILPDYNSGVIQCLVQSDASYFLLSHILASHTESQLEVKVASSHLFVHLKTPREVYSGNRQALYHAPVHSFSHAACPTFSFLTSTVGFSTCISCYGNVASDAFKSAIKSAMCPTNLACAQPYQHGPLCQECPAYMLAQGEVLPSHAEWVNGTVCHWQCESGYSLYESSGSCEPSSWVSNVKADSCVAYTSCEECVLAHCYFNGFSCQQDTFNNVDSSTDVFQICGTTASFCGPQDVNFNLQNTTMLVLQPPGNGALKVHKSLICVWDIHYINTPTNWKFGIYYEKLQVSSALPLCLISLYDYYLLSSTYTIISSTSFAFDNGLRVGAIFYEDSPTSYIRIVLNQAATGSTLTTDPTSQPSNIEDDEEIIPSAAEDPNTAYFVVIIVGPVLGMMCVICTCCCVRGCLKRSRRVPPLRVVRQEPRIHVQFLETSNSSDIGLKTERPPNDHSCSICLEDFEQNFAQTECGHFFHADCIKSWLERHDDCPNCRNPLRD